MDLNELKNLLMDKKVELLQEIEEFIGVDITEIELEITYGDEDCTLTV